jgi:hypothetical protein
VREDKERLFNQGADLIKGELENQAGEMISLRSQIDLKNVDLLSDNILINRNVHSTVKQQVKDFSENIKKIIAATAFFIEERGFVSLDQAIAGLDLQSKRDLTRLSSLVAAQKSIKLSYGTLSAVVEIFKRVNVSLLRDMALSQSDVHTSSVSDVRKNKTSLLLKNAILVYELTGFTISFLEKFRLEGMDDLEYIKKEVFSDIGENRKSDAKLRAMADRQKDLELRKTKGSGSFNPRENKGVRFI